MQVFVRLLRCKQAKLTKSRFVENSGLAILVIVARASVLQETCVREVQYDGFVYRVGVLQAYKYAPTQLIIHSRVSFGVVSTC
jgi:hypothetical protein